MLDPYKEIVLSRILFASFKYYVSGTLNLEVIIAFVWKDYFGFMVGGTLYLKMGLYFSAFLKKRIFSDSKFIGLYFPMLLVVKFFDQSKNITLSCFLISLYYSFNNSHFRKFFSKNPIFINYFLLWVLIWENKPIFFGFRLFLLYIRGFECDSDFLTLRRL